MSNADRRVLEKKIYHEVRGNKEEIKGAEDSSIFFIISSDWIELWKQYINRGQKLPPEINNHKLKAHIEEKRKKFTKNQTDDDIDIQGMVDYYEFSFSLWQFFREFYQGGPVILIQKKNKVPTGHT